MRRRHTAPAELPPPGIQGLDPTWSRLVRVPATDDVGRTWHLLDSWTDRSDEADPRLTVLCVHGNPSWSFLWRRVIATLPTDIRVVAVDQLDMGFSERTGRKRTLATRVQDLRELTTELGLSGPVVTVAHDWGGPISLGWALEHLDGTSPARLAGVVLTNTAVHQPAGSPAPSVIRLIRSRPMLRATTVNTLAFIRGAYEMSWPRLPVAVRHGFVAPYLDRHRREAIADFVNDIPLDPGHESAVDLDRIAEGLAGLTDVPALLLWGPRDKVFGDLYLHDLERRLPHADVHRFPGAAHFVSEDADVAGAIAAWLEALLDRVDDRTADDRPPQTRRGLTDFAHADPTDDAVIEMAPERRSITFGGLSTKVEQLAAGMASHGIEPGDRIALMIPPGIDLSIVIYACWRLGAVVVLVDSGLGPRGMQRALVGAAPSHLIGIDKALVAARALRWPGTPISLTPLSSAMAVALGCTTDVDSLLEAGRVTATELPDPPRFDAPAAVVFTSGATGPSKGVRYRHGQLEAQRDALMQRYGITPDDRLVAAFAPFALYGPTMGISSVVPDMDVTAPSTLTASALSVAVGAIDATLVFASPAALVNILATADGLSSVERGAFDSVRLLLSAGAPVRSGVLSDARPLFPTASAHTPYGMTEVLPVADISLDEILDAEAIGGDGVCVGRPLPSVEVRIDPLDELGRPIGNLTDNAGHLGEIVVRAPHARDGYDRLWFTEHRASQPDGWHRTGDVGSLDDNGRLWVGGRIGHVIVTAAGPIAPVQTEHQLEAIDGIAIAAVVGVGPIGTQVVVAVIERPEGARSAAAAPIELIDRARAATGPDIDLAAVLVTERLPVDRRHNSKIDRTAVAEWATATLTGQRAGSL